MKDHKKQLIEYFDKVMLVNYASENTKRNWMFGAADFSLKAGLIDSETFYELAEKYEIIK